MRNPYFRGVGIGLLIAWVTSVLAYWLQRKGIKHTKVPIPIALISLEIVFSVVFIVLSFLM